MSFVLPKKKVKIINLGKNTFSKISSYPKTFKTLTVQWDKSGLYKTGLTEQEKAELETLLGKKPGELGRKPADINGQNFWSMLEVKLTPTRGNELNLEDPIQFIKYKTLLVNDRVCNSPLEKNKWPSAEWMII